MRMNMERLAVQSRDIAVIGYDAHSSTLEIVFRQGGVYHYEHVPESIHRELMEADSIGTFFNQQIKGRFEYKKIS